jgi:hypothetical protein
MTAFVISKFGALSAIDIPPEGKWQVRAEISKLLYYLKAEFPEYGFP